MTFAELIKRFETIDRGTATLLRVWLDDYAKDPEDNYSKFYGFIRACAGTHIITYNEESKLINTLIEMTYPNNADD